jgi:hypothetical protein
MTMMVLAGVLMVATLFVVVFALVALAGWVERSRDEAAARQIQLTDAIHAQLGAVVAPTVVRRPWGAWQVLINVPFARPDLVAGVLSIAHDTIRRLDPRGFQRVRIVLGPSQESIGDRSIPARALMSQE